MITEKDLQEAILECLGQRNPNRDTCMALAAFYTIQDHMYPQEDKKFEPSYSFAPPPTEIPTDETVGNYGSSEFLQAINGKNPSKMWTVMDELMDTLLVVNKRVYDSIMRKIQ